MGCKMSMAMWSTAQRVLEVGRYEYLFSDNDASMKHSSYLGLEYNRIRTHSWTWVWFHISGSDSTSLGLQVLRVWVQVWVWY